jgi:hypothetical protein
MITTLIALLNIVVAVLTGIVVYDSIVGDLTHSCGNDEM